MKQRQILHVDLDAFFASVEQLDFPSYRGKPVIVGGLPGDRRSVVSTASYEARKFGVHSAMPTAKAYQLCPQGIYVRGRMERYHQISRQVMNIFRDFSPDVQQMSVDEAFIDITGTELLFGSAETTARKIKERIKAETGLTVSIGVASNKYLAKIASGMDKPDGLYVIPPGSEERFMLSLPLDKLWGVGAKTRKRLNDMGFYTIEDIHQATLPGLMQIFGECTGNYLYQAVRGLEANGFDDEPKSRSISAENTYSFDLTERDSILTALLNLSYTVYFRLLSEGFCSKTVHLKIRYEDFSTVSIQETLPRYISSSDDFYERVVALFDKKYDRTMGIRLLGVGAQNLEVGINGEQNELFDFGEGKKRAVETAILELQQKNPKNLVKKARQFLSCLALFACLTVPYQDLSAADRGTSLFHYEKDDTDIEFISEGTWESTVTSTGSLTFPSSGKPFFQLNPLVYSQKADLTLWFMLQNKWYFETDFADSYSDTAVSAGYYGDGIIQHIRIGNNGIFFPEYSSLAIAGSDRISESVNSPGIMASMGNDSWKLDAMVRFEQLDHCTQVWNGMNAVTNTDTELSQWEKDTFFYFPDPGILHEIQSIWVEDSSGTFFDKDGLTYRKLSPAQYLLLPNSGSVIFMENSVPSGSSILVELRPAGKNLLFNAWNQLTTDISCTFSPFSIEDYYDVTKPLFTSLQQTKEMASQTALTEENYLYLRSGHSFSPFADCSRYQRNQNSDSVTASIVFSGTGTTNAKYDVFTNNGLISWLQVAPSSVTNNASYRFPLAGDFPQLYVRGSSAILSSTTGLVLREQSVVPVEYYNIGTKAIGTTVTVRKNGVVIPAHYEASSGIVTLDTIPSPYDTITISWNEPSETAQNPILHSAVGFSLPITENTSFNAAASVMWPWITQASYSTPDNSQEGSLLLSAAYSGNLKFQNSSVSFNSITGVTASVTDVTGICRIEGFDTGSTSPLIFGTGALPDAKNKQVQYTVSRVKSELLPKDQLTRSGYEVTIEWNDAESFVTPVVFSQGAQYLHKAQLVSFWVKGSTESNSEIELYWGENKDILIDLIPYLNDQWQKISVSLTEKNRQILTEETDVFLSISSAAGTTTNGNLILCGDSQGLRGITLRAEGTNCHSIISEIKTPPATALYPTSLSWLSKETPVQASYYTGCVDNSEKDAVITSVELMKPFSLADYNTVQCLFMVPETCITAPDVTLELLSDTDDVLVTIHAERDTLQTLAGKWITYDYQLTAEDKTLLASTPVSKRRLTMTVPAETAENNACFELWYDELYASGMANELVLKNSTSAEYTRIAPLFTIGSLAFFSGSTVSLSADTSYAPHSHTMPSLTANGALSTTIPLFKLSGSIGLEEKDSTLNAVQWGYSITTDSDTRMGTYLQAATRYHTDEKKGTTSRADAITFSIPFSEKAHTITVSGATELSSTQKKWTQQADAAATIALKTAVPLSVSVSAGVKQSVLDFLSPLWIPTVIQQYSTGFSHAEKRSEQISGKLSLDLPFLSIKPALSVTVEEKTEPAKSNSLSRMQTGLSIPLSIGNHEVTAEYIETASLSEDITGLLSYGDDFRALADRTSALSDLLFSVPFIQTERALLKQQTIISDSAMMSSREEIRFLWKRPASFTYLDFLLPSSLESSFGTERTATSLSLGKSRFLQNSLSFASFNNLPIDTIQDETLTTATARLNNGMWSVSGIIAETVIFDNGAQISLITNGSLIANTKKQIQETVTVKHQSAKIDGISRYFHEEQGTFEYGTTGKADTLQKHNTLQVQHSTTAVLTENLKLSGLIKLSRVSGPDSVTYSYTVSVSGALSY